MWEKIQANSIWPALSERKVNYGIKININLLLLIVTCVPTAIEQENKGTKIVQRVTTSMSKHRHTKKVNHLGHWLLNLNEPATVYIANATYEYIFLFTVCTKELLNNLKKIKR